VYRRHPGSNPAEQQKKMNLDWKSFNLLTQLQMWEPSQEEARKEEE
jgi:hypothetical protein